MLNDTIKTWAFYVGLRVEEKIEFSLFVFQVVCPTQA